MNWAARSLAAGVLAGSAAWAAAAGWSTELADGRRVAIVADPLLGEAAQYIERRNADGSLDRKFGNGGRVVMSLGPESSGPRAIRADSSGRLLVVGSASGPQGHEVPAAMRFLPDGEPDATWGAHGRSLIAAVDAEATGADVLQLPDDSVLVLGQIGSPSGERAALWRLGRQGELDSSFGNSGVMRASGIESSQGLALQLDDDGAALIAIQTDDQGSPRLEVHRWQAGQEQPLRVARQPMPPDWQGPVMLGRRGGAWQWFDTAQGPISGGVPLMAVAAEAAWSNVATTSASPKGPAADVATEGGAAWNPFSKGTADDSAATAAKTSSDLPWEALGSVALLAALVGLGWWRLRRR